MTDFVVQPTSLTCPCCGAPLEQVWYHSYACTGCGAAFTARDLGINPKARRTNLRARAARADNPWAYRAAVRGRRIRHKV
jgi:hypothetical protein